MSVEIKTVKSNTNRGTVSWFGVTMIIVGVGLYFTSFSAAMIASGIVLFLDCMVDEALERCTLLKRGGD